MFNGNIWSNFALLWNIRLQNQSDIDFDRSRPLKVKRNSVIRLATYGFLLIFNY